MKTPSRISGKAWFFSLSLTLAVLFGAALPGALRASGDPAGDMPTELNIPVKAYLSQDSAPAGGTLQVAVVYDVPVGAHIQENEFFFARAADGEPFSLGTPVFPKSEDFEGIPIYKGKTTVYYTARLGSGLPPGNRVLHLVAGYQACVEEPAFACFAPQEGTQDLPIAITPAGSPPRPANQAVFAGMTKMPPPPASGAETAAAPPGGSQAPASDASGAIPSPAPGSGDGASSTGDAASGTAASAVTEASPSNSGPASAATVQSSGLAGKLEQALARRSFLAFLLVFLGGIAASFTPCVYPMIPITISYIGGRSKGRMGGFFLSIFFVLGIAITYSSLGALAAASGGLFGSAMQSTPVLLGVSAIFFAMGASMLGAFDLALPSGMQTKLQSGPRAGVLGAVFMGMVTGLVASPCVGPVVVVLLLWVGKMGSILLGFLYLFVFALGLGVLFLVIGTFAGALNALPQAGGWMDTVKHFFGAILLAMGIFYIRALLGPELTWIATGVFMVLVGTFLGAFRPVGEEPPKSLLLRKGFGIVLLLVGSFVLLVGVGRYAKVPFMVQGAASEASITAPPREEGLKWVSDDVGGLADARTQGRPAVIDFYADWCGACKELDEKTWSHAEVRREGERFVAIKMDLTKKNDWSAKKQSDYGVPGLPTVIFYNGAGQEVKRFFGFKPPEDVVALMKDIR